MVSMCLMTFHLLCSGHYYDLFSPQQPPVIELSNNAWGGLVYGQYTTTKGCFKLRCNAECLDTALIHGIFAIYHKTQRYVIAIINC
jgi:hypothetical protein